ncbi:hypothetical protein ACFL07_01790 [Pseudomonadota bacterium]
MQQKTVKWTAFGTVAVIGLAFFIAQIINQQVQETALETYLATEKTRTQTPVRSQGKRRLRYSRVPTCEK